jgi:hypothetical protein
MRAAAWRMLKCQSNNSVENSENRQQKGPAFINSHKLAPDDNLAILKDIWAKA